CATVYVPDRVQVVTPLLSEQLAADEGEGKKAVASAATSVDAGQGRRRSIMGLVLSERRKPSTDRSGLPSWTAWSVAPYPGSKIPTVSAISVVLVIVRSETD